MGHPLSSENPDCKSRCSQPLNEATQAIHTPFAQRDPYDALSLPVYQSVSYEFDTAAAMTEAFSGRSGVPDYSRTGNPSVSHFEDRVKALTGAKSVTAFNSGMAAISNMFLAIAAQGKNIVASKHLFGNTFSLLTESLARFGVETRLADLTNAEETAHYFELAQRQFGHTAGAMVCIDLESEAACFEFINRLRLIHRATNLFDNRSLAIFTAPSSWLSRPNKRRRWTYLTRRCA